VELLRKAARAYLETEVALIYLKEADRLYGNFIPVVVGCYKFHFYKGMLREAIPYALKAARIMGDHLGLPGSFELVRPDDAAFSEYEQEPRFYMFAMKAVGYLHARLGETEKALGILRKVRELDSQDRMGITRLIGVIENGGREEEE
jgi:tetratricopeptide (TPR) repeat protein